MSSNMLKLSTIYSYKGWEADNIFLVIQRPSKTSDAENYPELIYTAITRAKKNLYIINLGNEKYHPFFTRIDGGEMAIVAYYIPDAHGCKWTLLGEFEIYLNSNEKQMLEESETWRNKKYLNDWELVGINHGIIYDRITNVIYNRIKDDEKQYPIVFTLRIENINK